MCPMMRHFDVLLYVVVFLSYLTNWFLGPQVYLVRKHPWKDLLPLSLCRRKRRRALCPPGPKWHLKQHRCQGCMAMSGHQRRAGSCFYPQLCNFFKKKLILSKVPNVSICAASLRFLFRLHMRKPPAEAQKQAEAMMSEDPTVRSLKVDVLDGVLLQRPWVCLKILREHGKPSAKGKKSLARKSKCLSSDGHRLGCPSYQNRTAGWGLSIWRGLGRHQGGMGNDCVRG